MPGPLDGIRGVDVSAILAGPLATMMLADQGADVIKIEPPGIGDLMRLSPFRRGGMGAFFASGNRGKRSAAIDRRGTAKKPASGNLGEATETPPKNVAAYSRSIFLLTRATRQHQPAQ